MDRQLPPPPATTQAPRASRSTGTLLTLTEIFTNLFTRYNVREPDKLAEATVRTLAGYFGGRCVYLPRGESITRVLRDARIYAEAGKIPVTELAEREGLTTTRVYQIIKEVRAHKLAQRKLLPVATPTGSPFTSEKPL